MATHAADSEPPAKRTRRSLGDFTSKLNAEPEVSQSSHLVTQFSRKSDQFRRLPTVEPYPSGRLTAATGPSNFRLLRRVTSFSSAIRIPRFRIVSRSTHWPANVPSDISHPKTPNVTETLKAYLTISRKRSSSRDMAIRVRSNSKDIRIAAPRLTRNSRTVDEMSDQECIDSNQRIADDRVSTSSKGQSKKATGEPPRHTATDLPMTRSSRPYGKPEIQPISRPSSGLIDASKWYNLSGEEPTPVRSDLQ